MALRIQLGQLHNADATIAVVIASERTNQQPLVSTPTRRPKRESLPKQLQNLRPEDVDVELFIIWHGAMHKLSAILENIASRFIILAVTRFRWLVPHEKDKLANDNFLNNLWRLYSGKGGWNKTGMPLKVKQCGKGDFVGVVVVDAQPLYVEEKTAHGLDVVNHNMNEAKSMYRKWAGGGFKVHGTFSQEEAMHDIILLFHRDKITFAHTLFNETFADILPAFLLADSRADFATETNFFSRQFTLGFNGWSSCDQFALAMNAVPHVKFFPFGALQQELLVADCAEWPSHVTMLIPSRSFWAVVSLLNGKPKSFPPRGVPTSFEVRIAVKQYVIDVDAIANDKLHGDRK